MTPEARPRIDTVREFLPTSPLVGHLGIELRELEADRAVLALPFAAHVVTIGDVVHGGAIASLMDTAAMMAAWATDEPAERLAGATVALSIDYVAPARASEVLAEALVVRRGRALCFVEISARAGADVVAKALATYRFG